MDAEFQWDSWQWKEILGSLKIKWKDIEERKKFGDVVSPAVYDDVIDHFRNEEGEKGGWQAWSKSYAEHMQRIGKGGNLILQDSGRLRQWFKPSSWRGTSDGLLFYNNAKTKKGFPYAYAHDTGGPQLPQRGFMWLSGAGVDRMIQIVQGWLADGED